MGEERPTRGTLFSHLLFTVLGSRRVLRYKPLIALSLLVHFFTHVVFEGEKLRKKWDDITFQILCSTEHQGGVILVEPQSLVTRWAEECSIFPRLLVVMIDIERTMFFANPTPMLLQEFPMLPGVEIDPIRAEQPGILRTPDTPALILDVTRFPLRRIEFVVGRFVDLTLRAPLLTMTILLNKRGGFAHRKIPGLMDTPEDMWQLMIGTDIGNSFVYQDRVVHKRFQKPYTLHTQKFPYSENSTIIHT